MSVKFKEDIYKQVPVNNNCEIRVLTTTDLTNNKKLVDIRKYMLYGNKYDDIKRYTKKGIRLTLDNVKPVVEGLLDILVSNDNLDIQKAEEIKKRLCD